MQSLHVPASTMQRLVRVAFWAAPSSASVLAAALFAYRWFGSRASLDDVGTKVATANIAAKAAQADALHAASIADGHTAELRALWLHVIAMRAELQISRAYSKADAATRGAYVESARGWYTLRFDEQMRTHANNPAEAAALALGQQWRPDR